MAPTTHRRVHIHFMVTERERMTDNPALLTKNWIDAEVKYKTCNSQIVQCSTAGEKPMAKKYLGGCITDCLREAFWHRPREFLHKIFTV